MGMFDKPLYLTGEEGFVQAGDEFWLHNAKLDGTTTVGGDTRDQAKLQVSLEEGGEKVVVLTSGTGIVNQVKRMDQNDRAQFPIRLRLDQVPSKHGNPTNVLTPANQPEPSGADGQEPIAF